MTKLTIRQQLETAILATGGKRMQDTRVSKAVVFTHPQITEERFIFLGKAGSLRVGRTRTESIPWDKFKARLLNLKASTAPNSSSTKR